MTNDRRSKDRLYVNELYFDLVVDHLTHIHDTLYGRYFECSTMNGDHLTGDQLS